jgi:subtilisin-like proprotein convertase family protein
MQTSTTQTLKPRSLIATLVFLLAAILAVTLIAITVGAGEANAGKPVPGTYVSHGKITIPDLGEASRYPWTINVRTSGTITDVNVTIKGFTHTYPNDVDVKLVGPQGHQAILMDSAGGGTDVSGINITFDDEATSTLPYPLATGTYQPSQSLSVFDNTNLNGTWKLYVNDHSGGDHGSMSGWSLTITTA